MPDRDLTDEQRERLAIVQIGTIKALIDELADLKVTPLHLRIDAKKVGDTRPDVSLWMQTRTDFEALARRWKAKATERRFSPEGQREWFAEHDNDGIRVLVQVVSFRHHEDWEPRQTEARP